MAKAGIGFAHLTDVFSPGFLSLRIKGDFGAACHATGWRFKKKPSPHVTNNRKILSRIVKYFLINIQ